MDDHERPGFMDVAAVSDGKDGLEQVVKKRKQSFEDRGAGRVANTSDEDSLPDMARSGDAVAEQQNDGPEESDRVALAVQEESVLSEERQPPPDHRIAKQQARVDALKNQLQELTKEIDSARVLLRNPDANATVARHIKLLHEYNEIRDVGLGLMGMVAERRAVRVAQVMAEYGVGNED